MSEMPIEYHLNEADLGTAHAIAVVRPGDTLVINSPGPMSMDAATQIKDQAVASLPEGVKVLVVTNGLTVTIARGSERDGTLEGVTR